jgi:DNA ligase-1
LFISQKLKHFAHLIETLEHARDDSEIIERVVQYFKSAIPEQDKSAALCLLLNIRPKRICSSKDLKPMAPSLYGFPDWLIERCESETGSLTHALALLTVTGKETNSCSLSAWIDECRKASYQEDFNLENFIKKKAAFRTVTENWTSLKLLTGTFRSPLPISLLHKALAMALNISKEIVSLRLHRQTEGELIGYQSIKVPIKYEKLMIPDELQTIKAIEASVLEDFGSPNSWQFYGIMYGINVRLVKYQHHVGIWSEAGQLISNQFPEVLENLSRLNTNLRFRGIIVPKSNQTPLPVIEGRLQKGFISRSECEKHPAMLMLLVKKGEYATINQMLDDKPLIEIIQPLWFSAWQSLRNYHNRCHKIGLRGILLQHTKHDECYFLKADALSLKAVLTTIGFGPYSISGIDSLTFAVHHKNGLIPIATLRNFPTSIDFAPILAFCKENTLERFGPVRTVRPELVFELFFDGITKSSRRKSGLILSNVAISKQLAVSLDAAETLDNLYRFLPSSDPPNQ